MFTVSRIGCNLCRFWNNSEEICIVLEYDFDKQDFIRFSEYIITHTYYYHGKSYKTYKGTVNYNRYLRILDSITPNEWKQAKEIFEGVTIIH